MAAVRDMELWTQLRSGRFALFLTATVLCLIRARDQPAVHVGLGSTQVDVVPADLALIALVLVALASFVRRGLPREAWAPIALASVFCVVLLGTAAVNGTAALVSGVKLCELAALGLAAIAFLRTRRQLDALGDTLILFTAVADAYGVVKFLQGGGGRQPSFLGEHDFAAIATLPLFYGLVLLYEDRRRRRGWLAVVIGSAGCILGAALASLLGLYLGAGLLMLTRGVGRKLSLRDFLTTAAVVAVVTGGTVTLRAGELGFLQSWFGKPPSRPGQYASSWSQRLIYAYVGGRIFLDRPILGTGWWSDLPAKEYARYLPDARRRFSDQPPNYFPTAHGTFVPQQTYDEVLYELGAVGGLSFLGLLVSFGGAATRAARRGADVITSSVPAAWLAATAGAIAGEGFFGGTPLAASFWLVGGVVVGLSLTRTDA
ncbi:MAG: hypothetical protein ACXVRJ_05440 [Gaiellaceae bacterium]